MKKRITARLSALKMRERKCKNTGNGVSENGTTKKKIMVTFRVTKRELLFFC